MRINYSRGEDTDKIAREIADAVSEVCQDKCAAMIMAGE